MLRSGGGSRSSSFRPNPRSSREAPPETSPLDQFLTALNRRIAEQAGNEKQIGHSFFLQGEDVGDDVAEFGRRFREEVLPLLQEYCYEDPAALARPLGTKLVDPETGELDLDLLRDDEELAEALANELLAGRFRRCERIFAAHRDGLRVGGGDASGRASRRRRRQARATASGRAAGGRRGAP
jgi:hypothetical protein